MKLRYSIADIKKLALKKQNNIWNVLFAEHFAVRMLWAVANFTKITPNQITLLSFVLFLATAGLFFKGYILLGALTYEFAHFLDIVDGRLASLKNMGSKKGMFLDTFADLIGVILISLGLSYHFFFKNNNLSFLMAGFLYIVLVLLLQLMYHVTYRLNDNTLLIQKIKTKNTSLLQRLRQLLAKKRIRLMYTNVETNNILFFICPIASLLFGEKSFVVGFFLSDLMLFSLFVALFYLQMKVLMKEERGV